MKSGFYWEKIEREKIGLRHYYLSKLKNKNFEDLENIYK